MMSIELYLNGRLCDLVDATRIALTRQANNIAELQDRQGDFTGEIQLPMTATNRSIMESAEIINSGTQVPYRKLTSRYVDDGVDSIREGVAVLLRTENRMYVVKINSGNSSFFGLFPDMKVSQLIGDSLDHINSFDNVIDSRSATTGYIYPFIDWYTSTYEQGFTTDIVNPKYLLPAVFIHYLFDLVDQYTGFDSVGTLKQLPDFEQLLLTPNGLQRGEAAQQFYNASAVNSTDEVFLIGVNNGAPTVINSTPTLDVYDGNFSGNLFTADAGLFGYFIFSGSLQLKYKRYEFAQRVVVVTCQIVRTAGNVVIEEEIVFSQLTILDPSELEITVDLFFNVISTNITFTAGESYYARLHVEDTLKSEVTFLADNEFQFNLESAVPYNGFMPVGELFENITVKQVYQDVLNMFASVPQTDGFKGKVDFGLFEDLTTNIPIAPNWTDRVQPDGHILSYQFGKYAKENFLKYNPTETVTPGYGDSSFLIDDETLPDIETVVQLTVSATEDEVRYQGRTYPRIKSLENGTRAFTATNYRILKLQRTNTAYPHTYNDGTDSLVVNTDIPYVDFRDLRFEVIKGVYYATLINMLTKIKASSLRVKLTRQDVQELNHLIPVQLDVHHPEVDAVGYFYVSQIGEYINGFARALLVRM